MREALPNRRFGFVVSFLGHLAASLLSLLGGALLAVSVDGPPRLVLAGVGFAGYLFFFCRAFGEISLPHVILEGDPDPEREREKAREASPGRRRGRGR
jgi:hypothetical protein